MTETMDQCSIESSLVDRVLDGLCAGLVMMSPTGRVSYMNRAAQRTLGIDLGEAQGQPFARFLRDPQLAAFWREAMRSQVTAVGEVSLHWPRRAALRINATTALGMSGELIGRALLLSDVTAERTIRLTLSRAATEHLPEVAERWTDKAQARTHLTAKERRVLRLVGAGLSNAQIAAEMGVAPSTVRSHLKHIYKKLGLGCRSEAISYALRHGMA